MQLKVRKTLTLPAELVYLLQDKASKLGFDFPEFVRFVLANEVKNDVTDYKPNAEAEKMLNRAAEEFKTGEYTDVQNPEDILKQLNVH